MDTLFFLACRVDQARSRGLNRCRMNAISGWQAFFPVHFQEFNPALAPQRPPSGAGPGPLPLRVRTLPGGCRRGRFDRPGFGRGCFYNADYLAAGAGWPPTWQAGKEEALEGLEVMDVSSGSQGSTFSGPWSQGWCRSSPCGTAALGSARNSTTRCRLSNLGGLGGRAQLAMACSSRSRPAAPSVLSPRPTSTHSPCRAPPGRQARCMDRWESSPLCFFFFVRKCY